MVCLGCQVAVPWQVPDPHAAAEELWDRGQEAMRAGDTDRAIECYEQSLALDPELARNHLSLAAAYLEKGDEPTACAHLAEYVTCHPEHLVIRLHLAELLYRLGRLEDARLHFERHIADAQDQGNEMARLIVRCHTRLMELAQLDHDGYHEHLHRGIGLYWLARQRADLPEPEDDLPVEGLLCKSAAELTLASRLCPEEARPYWYLYEVWARLGQRRPALRCLEAAQETAPFSYLSPRERRELHDTCHSLAAEPRIR
jgi:tetratricopeptide (TPR) repeat protein